ncbi:unnamed protein product, partial [Ectocarpus sp. 6 AP-2014]
TAGNQGAKPPEQWGRHRRSYRPSRGGPGAYHVARFLDQRRLVRTSREERRQRDQRQRAGNPGLLGCPLPLAQCRSRRTGGREEEEEEEEAGDGASTEIEAAELGAGAGGIPRAVGPSSCAMTPRQVDEDAAAAAAAVAAERAELEARAERAEADAKDKEEMASRALEAAVRSEEEARAVREEALGAIDSAQERVWRLEERAQRVMEEALAAASKITSRREEEARKASQQRDSRAGLVCASQGNNDSNDSIQAAAAVSGQDTVQ